MKYAPRIVAHLFSAERRQGDVQSFLEVAGFSALSMLRGAICYVLIHWRYSSGQSGSAGPPCETWSQARAVDCPRGPRVIRSRERLQGVKHLRRKEAQQIEVGNQLDDPGVVRHCEWSHRAGYPAEPENKELPSIWHLAIISFYLRFACCQRVRIEQGRYGGLSPKPTDLLVVHGSHEVHSIFVEQ